MAGRSSQADNRGTNFLGFLASGKGKQFHTYRDAKTISQVGHTATGGVISDYSDGGNLYRSHIFTSTGEFSVTEATEAFGQTVEFLLVAGGGAGGDNISGAHGGNGGGGGGGLVEGNALPVTPTTTFTITIGAGGADSVKSAMPGNVGTPGPARNGANSTISGPTITTVTAKGGGGGGNDNSDSVGPGGSGGGSWGGGGAGPTTGGSTTQSGTNSLYGATDYGFAGGASSATPHFNAAGGGGAGAVGGDASNSGTSTGGNGGAGRASTIAYGPTNPVTYAGGGAGGNTPYGGTGGTGGAGGGGDVGSFGEYATGGGGGGALAATAERLAGGSGIAVFRYRIGSTSTAKATGGAISFYGGKTIHVFTSSGTFVNPGSISDAEIFMIGGGGSGGTNIAGGGGAGAVMSGSSLTMPANTYTITVGAGGVGRTSLGYLTGFPANDTTITYPGPYTITAQRGGYGASYTSVAAQTGGSGGGGTSSQTTGASPTKANSTTPIGTLTAYGNAGGSTSGDFQGAGGGGAGGAGNNNSVAGTGAAGGVGMQIPTTFRDPRSAPSDSSNPQPYQRGGGLGTPGPSPGGFYVAAGGGGAGYPGNDASTRGLGGAGGGGDGGYHTQSPPATDGQSAVQNTGSGGGGSGYSPSTRSTAGSGGSGLVLIAYPT